VWSVSGGVAGKCAVEKVAAGQELIMTEKAKIL
jgi:hypothetical protein